SNDQFKLYKLIYERMLASQMAPAIMDTVTAHLSNNGIEFRANGSQVKFKGIMKVYVEGVDNKKQEEEGYLPELKEGEKVSAKIITQNKHFTQLPPRYTDATLTVVIDKHVLG